jgi:long-chain acyl-CoA synthetase
VTLSGRHVVVTGFTGFVAKVFVALLLEEVEDIGRVTVLVRPRGRLRPARARTEQILERSPAFRPTRRRTDLERWLGERLDAIDADVEKPLCGLTPDDLERLASADVVVHCAGLTDFAPDPTKAVSANIAGAVHVAELAEALRVPMVHVSTCFVAGNLGEATVPEELRVGVAPHGQPLDAAAEIRALQLACRQTPAASDRVELALARGRALGWPNIYTYTKGLAEHVLAARPDLDLTIVRPSIVECARAFPFPGWNEGLNTAGPLAWLISTAFRRLPTVPEHRFDVVPVDDAARGLAAITAAAVEGRAGGVFHLASGDHNPLTFARAVELTGLGMRRWTARGGGTPLDRLLLRHLDPVPVPADRPGPLAVDRVRRWGAWLRAKLADVPHDRVPEEAAAWLGTVDAQLGETDERLARVERMLELYLPFIHDNDWTFDTRRARAVSARDPAFRFDLSDIDWCTYWVDVEYPGLRTWCIPLIDGHDVPDDPPALRPLVLERRPRTEDRAEVWAARVASK